MQSPSVVPPAVSALHTLFETDLAGVSFPDVDQAALQAQIEQCRARAAEVEQLAAQLNEARQRLVAQQADLAALSKKAIAYAKIYSADDAVLYGKLDALVIDKRRGARGGKRGAAAGTRKRRRAATAASDKSAVVSAGDGGEHAAVERRRGDEGAVKLKVAG